MYTPSEMDVDFTVKWNWDVESHEYTTARNQNKVNNVLCVTSEVKDNNLPWAADFTNSGTTDLRTAVGVGLTGVMILSSVNFQEVDPLYPTVYGSVTNADDAKEHFDTCLAHT